MYRPIFGLSVVIGVSADHYQKTEPIKTDHFAQESLDFHRFQDFCQKHFSKIDIFSMVNTVGSNKDLLSVSKLLDKYIGN